MHPVRTGRTSLTSLYRADCAHPVNRPPSPGRPRTSPTGQASTQRRTCSLNRTRAPELGPTPLGALQLTRHPILVHRLISSQCVQCQLFLSFSQQCGWHTTHSCSLIARICMSISRCMYMPPWALSIAHSLARLAGHTIISRWPAVAASVRSALALPVFLRTPWVCVWPASHPSRYLSHLTPLVSFCTSVTRVPTSRVSLRRCGAVPCERSAYAGCAC